MIPRRGQKAALPHVSLRPAEERDCELLWQWRNEKETRKWSFNSTLILYEEHENWFSNKLHSADTRILIILNENESEIGQVRFDISGDKSAEIDISIDAIERNKGYGTSALKLACQYALEHLVIKKVIAHIKEGNQASIYAFAKAGFKNKGLRDFKGHKAIEMVLAWGQ